MFARNATWLKITAVAFLFIFLLAACLYLLGRSVGNAEGRAEVEIEAAKNAFDRIEKLEKNNASFKDLTPRHRCLAYMRDSRLPDSTCD